MYSIEFVRNRLLPTSKFATSSYARSSSFGIDLSASCSLASSRRCPSGRCLHSLERSCISKSVALRSRILENITVPTTTSRAGVSFPFRSRVWQALQFVEFSETAKFHSSIRIFEQTKFGGPCHPAPPSQVCRQRLRKLAGVPESSRLEGNLR